MAGSRRGHPVCSPLSGCILPHAPIRLSSLRLLILTFSRRSAVPAQETPASVRACFRKCSGARLDRTARAGRARPPGTAASRSRSTLARSTAACGRPRMRDARGRRSSTISPPDRSGQSWSHRRTPTPCTSAAGKGCTGRISRPGTASTSRPMPGEHGRTSAFATRSRSRRSRSIRATRIGSSSRHSVTRTVPTTNAGSTVRPMADAASRRSSRRTRTPAATTSTSIPRIPRSSMRRCGKSVRDRGRTRSGPAPTAVSSSPPTAARPGIN